MDHATQYGLEKIQRDRIKSILYAEKLDIILRNITNSAQAVREHLEQATDDRQSFLVAVSGTNIPTKKVLEDAIEALQAGTLIDDAIECIRELEKIRQVANAENRIEQAERHVYEARKELERIGPIKEYP